jgi:exopolysaccharide production protein ExoZ
MSAGRPHRYLSLQAGRAIAALLVLVHHAAYFLSDPARWNRPDIFQRLAGPAFGVEAFFVLSGIVIFMAHRRDLDHLASVSSYLWKRFRRVYPMYWIVLALTLGMQFAEHEPLHVAQRTHLRILSAALLVGFIPGSEAFVAVSWTLYHEVMFYLLFAAALVNRWLGALLLGIWFLLSLLHLSGVTSLVSFVSPLHLLFGLGMLAGWVLRKGNTSSPVALLLLGNLIFWGDLVYAAFAEKNVGMLLAAGLGAFLIFLGTAELEAQGRLPIAPWLVFLGDASYSIYLIHFGVMSKLSGVCFRWNVYLHWPALVWLPVLCAGGLLVGCMLHVWIERPLLTWLSGPRKPAPALAPANAAS